MSIYQGGKILSSGATPYSFAKQAGFEGSEAEFNALLAQIDDVATKEELEAAIAAIPTPDVSGQIGDHNRSNDAHPYIRDEMSAMNERLVASIADKVSGLNQTINNNVSALNSTMETNAATAKNYTDAQVSTAEDEIFNELQNGTTVVKAAERDGGNNKIVDTYETKTDANTKLSNAKEFATQEADRVKNELLNGAGDAYDTLKELGALIDTNTNAIDALRDVAAGKADKVHSHTKSEITDFPTSMPASDVSAWAKQPTKPSYNKSEVGLSNVDNVRQYSAENPPVLFQSEAPDDTSAIWVDFDDNYLDEFSDAVELALAQAKASGQFDGKDGTPGKNGDPGETPQRGVDYWTPADQEAIVQQVIDALGTPVFGRVDVDNNIILTGELTNGTYTLKYEGINGNVADIGSVTITDGNDVPETPQVINQLTISTDTDGSIFNGTGYKVGYRLSSSSAVTAVDVPAASNPVFVTGFIPVQQGQTIHLKDCYIDTDGINGSPSSTETKNYYGHATGSLNILICNSAKATQHVVNWGATKTSEHFTVTPDSDGIVTEITCNKAGMAYLRLVLAGDPTKAVITVE